MQVDVSVVIVAILVRPERFREVTTLREAEVYLVKGP